jgi:hypothetical protein
LISVPILLIAGFALLQTYDLNSESKFWGVLMISSKYGNPWLFLLTAFAGIFLVLAFSRAIGLNLPPLNFVGQNTIIFLGLNGLCQHFIDRIVIDALNLTVKTHFEVFLYTSIYVIVMLTLFSPLVMGLRRWFPQMVGLKWSEASLLPPLEEWGQRGLGGWLVTGLKKVVLN